MRNALLVGALCGLALAAQVRAQQVEISRDASTQGMGRPVVSSVQEKERNQAGPQVVIVQPAVPPVSRRSEPPRTKITLEQMRQAGARARERVERENRPETARMPAVVASRPSKPTPGFTNGVDRQLRDSESIPARSVSLSMESAFTKLADGFDFPVGKPDAQGYYKARGFRSHGHLGEDWDGVGGGDTDLGDPIYSIGDGVVAFARDCHMGWGNVVIIRHAYREDGVVKNIDSLYGHLDTILVRRGQAVARGQKIGTMGTAHGLYDAHLHLEVRKNISIGMSRAAFAGDLSNYYDPTQFILSHRHLRTERGTYRIAMNTFTHDALIHWDRERNFTHARTGGGSSESANALKTALAAQSSGGR